MRGQCERTQRKKIKVKKNENKIVNLQT